MLVTVVVGDNTNNGGENTNYGGEVSLVRDLWECIAKILIVKI